MSISKVGRSFNPAGWTHAERLACAWFDKNQGWRETIGMDEIWTLAHVFERALDLRDRYEQMLNHQGDEDDLRATLAAFDKQVKGLEDTKK